jgi:tetratricopeptide (TPR) repeat protein
VTKGYEETLAVIAARNVRRAARASLVLDDLFRRLVVSRHSIEADATENEIWTVWMHHPHRSAAETISLAVNDIAARRYDIAETRLTLLTRRLPDFAEAWHKRATLYYMLGEDRACVRDLHRALLLEPRHFAAILHFAEILLGAERPSDARFAFSAALSLHPHLQRAKEALSGP